jgi:hypothetical protein
MMDHPIADRASGAGDPMAMGAEQRAGHAELARQLLRASVQEIRELPDGYAFRFPAELCRNVAEFVALERLGCPTCTFVLEIEHDGGPIWLRITGREGVKQFLQTELGV